MISVVIPAYNEEKYIGTVLAALAAQEIDEPVEVIVADADSRDRTREIVESFRDRFASVRIVKGGLPSVGRNAGARVASGDVIVFLDADMDLPDRAFLARNVGHLRRRGLAAATTRLVPQSDRALDRLMVGFYNILLRPAARIRPLGSMCILVTRETFEKTGGYPEDVVMAEDHDFVLRCSQVGQYGVVPVAAHFHTRRLDKEGRMGLAGKYLKATVIRVFRGPIKQFDYEFGYSEEAKEDKTKKS